AMSLDLERVKQNVHEAETVDLLDRITAYRHGMEPEAIALIEDELQRRGVSAEDVQAHAEHLKRDAIYDHEGTAFRCAVCNRPAVTRVWGWHRLWGLLPLVPRPYYYCALHQPTTPGP